MPLLSLELPKRLSRANGAAHPAPKRWTVKEFHDLRSRGTFGNRRAILLRGVIVELGPMNPRHAEAVEHLNSWLFSLFGKGWRIRPQLPLVVERDSDPFPDFAIIKGEFRPSKKHPATASLVIEVADSSRRIDVDIKSTLYAETGLPEYWVLDLVKDELVVFRDPVGDEYQSKQTFQKNDSFSMLALPRRTIKVKDLFPE